MRRLRLWPCLEYPVAESCTCDLLPPTSGQKPLPDSFRNDFADEVLSDAASIIFMLVWLSHIREKAVLPVFFMLDIVRDAEERVCRCAASLPATTAHVRHQTQIITYSARSHPTLLHVHKSAGLYFETDTDSIAAFVLERLFVLGLMIRCYSRS